MNKKRILIVIIMLLLVIGLGIGVYLFVNNREAANDNKEDGVERQVQNEDINGALAENPIYFTKSDGTYKLTSIDSEPTKISDEQGDVTADGTKIVHVSNITVFIKNLNNGDVTLTLKLSEGEWYQSVSKSGRYILTRTGSQSVGELVYNIYDNGFLLTSHRPSETRDLWFGDTLFFMDFEVACSTSFCTNISSIDLTRPIKKTSIINIESSSLKNKHTLYKEGDVVTLIISARDFVSTEGVRRFVYSDFEVLAYDAIAKTVVQVEYEDTAFYKAKKVLESKSIDYMINKLGVLGTSLFSVEASKGGDRYLYIISDDQIVYDALLV